MRDANDLGYMVTETAIGSEAGTVDFFLSPKAESSNSMNADFRPGAAKITVPLTTIDRFASSGAPAPTIMKIDVETLEADVLAGGRKTIAAHRPIITCEFLPRADGVDGIGELLSWLAYYGYNFYQVTESGEFEQYSHKDALSALDSVMRDWVLSPEPLTKDFYTSLGSWREAMPSSDASTNILVDGGQKFQEIETMW